MPNYSTLALELRELILANLITSCAYSTLTDLQLHDQLLIIYHTFPPNEYLKPLKAAAGTYKHRAEVAQAVMDAKLNEMPPLNYTLSPDGAHLTIHDLAAGMQDVDLSGIDDKRLMETCGRVVEKFVRMVGVRERFGERAAAGGEDAGAEAEDGGEGEAVHTQSAG